MRFWTFVKLASALIVAALVTLSTFFTLHVIGRPVPSFLARWFHQWMPEPERVMTDPAHDYEKVVDLSEMADIEPGDKAFQKASELLATGKIAEAREKLLTLVNYYPASNAAPLARKILGEMNMDDFLSLHHNPQVIPHKVGRGDSYLGIATKNQSTLDAIMHFNGLLELRPLQPGDELMVLPLHLRVVIEPKRHTLTLWNGHAFLKEYPLRKCIGLPQKTTTLKIINKGGLLGSKKVAPGMKGYRDAQKTIELSNKCQIVPSSMSGVHGCHLDPMDAEELALLLRVGNDVEIRP